MLLMPVECLEVVDHDARLYRKDNWSVESAPTGCNAIEATFDWAGNVCCDCIEVWESVDDSMARVIWLARSKGFLTLNTLRRWVSTLYTT